MALHSAESALGPHEEAWVGIPRNEQNKKCFFVHVFAVVEAQKTSGHVERCDR